jgi:hypothetical protein
MFLAPETVRLVRVALELHLAFFLLRELEAESLDGPVVDKIMFEAAFVVEFLEKSAQVDVVGCLVELEVAAVAHVGGYFFGVA